MEKYYIFIDETGSSDPLKYETDPFYTVTAVLMSEKVKDKLSNELSKLKNKYFGSKNYVLHRNKIRSAIKHKNKDLKSFLKELTPILDMNFYLFQVLVDQEKASSKKSWDKLHVYKQTYKILLGNIVKFSIARDVRSIICTEASSVSQDINIYESFFHYIANGIEYLGINPQTIKKHLTSLNFVTKINGDAGEQLADLFSKTPIDRYEIENNKKDKSSCNDLDLLLYQKSLIRSNQLTIPSNCNNPLKKSIYPTITTFKIIP